MIRNHSISVIITTYIRFKNLDRIIGAWLREPIDQLWVLDGSGRFRSSIKDQRFVLFSLPVDLGPKMDYAFALLTEGDIIILADDDVLIKDGFVSDLYRGWIEVGGGIVGIIGRKFNGPTYWGDTQFFRSSLLKAPQRVDFVGVVYFSPRKHFGFDVRGLPRNCDDLWWEMKVHPEVPKFVVPTTRYANLPEASDESAMYKNPRLRRQREYFYREYYLLNYAKREKTG